MVASNDVQGPPYATVLWFFMYIWPIHQRFYPYLLNIRLHKTKRLQLGTFDMLNKHYFSMNKLLTICVLLMLCNILKVRHKKHPDYDRGFDNNIM